MITIQAIAFYCGETFTNELTFLHFTVRDIPFLKKLIYSFEFISLALVFFLISSFLSYILFYFLNKFTLKNIDIKIKYFCVVVLFIVLNIENGIYNNIRDLINVQTAEKITFDEALENLGIPNKSYVKPENITAKKGKNIIIISMESLEKGFIEEKPSLTPNLNKLKQEMAYFDMQQNAGSAITVASMYTFITGIPMYFSYESLHSLESIIGDYADRRSMTSYRSQITSLPYVLEKAGYYQLYLSSALGRNGNFGGTQSILDAFHVNLNSLYNQSGNDWSRDSKLFDHLKTEISLLSKSDKPFALYMSTISTHGPNGLYDKAMEKKIEKKETILDFSVASLDYLIGDLLAYLESNNILDETAIFIFPDHRFMFGATHKFDGNRGLFLITNTPFDDLSYPKNNRIQQIDLPKIILQGAGVKHNAKFLTDFIDEDKLQFINKHKVELSQLNEASLRGTYRHETD